MPDSKRPDELRTALLDDLGRLGAGRAADDRLGAGEGEISPRAQEALADAGWAPSGEASGSGHRSVALIALDGGPGLTDAREGARRPADRRRAHRA